MSRHTHQMAVIAHNDEPKALLMCRVFGCIATDVLRPHKTKKDKSPFYDELATLPHICCGGDPARLPQRPPQEKAA